MSGSAIPAAADASAAGTAPADAPPITLPLDSYVMTPSQTSTLLNAYQRLLAECVHAAGFSFQVIPASASAANTVDLQSRFGLNSLRDAQTYGYQPDAARRQANARAQSEPRYSAAENDVIFGTAAQQKAVKGPAGCSGWAWSALGNTDAAGNSIASTPFAVSLQERAHASTESDPRMTAVNTQWSACMRRRGYGFPAPNAASGSPQWRRAALAQPAATAPMPTSVEIATAVADVQCKHAVNFVYLSAQIDTSYQNQLIARNAAALRAEKARRDAVLAKAEQVLSRQ